MAFYDVSDTLSPPATNLYGDSNVSGGESSSYTSGDMSSVLDVQEGYDLEFVPARSDKYDCPICLLILRDPMQTECGHRFCKTCILKWLRESESRCPVDNQPLEERQLFPDNFAKREILDLQVKCPNHARGCDQILVLNYLQSHLSDCAYSLSPCSNECGDILLRRDLMIHLQSSCPKRRVKCPLCDTQIRADELESHKVCCPKLAVNCSRCGEQTTFQDLSFHKTTKCQREIIQCGYQLLGCIHACERKDMSSHMQSQIEYHMSLMHSAILFLFRVLNVNPTLQQAAEGGSHIPIENSVHTADLDAASLSMIQHLFQRLNLQPAHVNSMPQLGQAGPSSVAQGVSPVRTASMPPTLRGATQNTTVSSDTGERTLSNRTQMTETSFSSVPTHRQDNEQPQMSMHENQFQSFKSQNDLQDESLARHDQLLVELKDQTVFQENVIKDLRLKVKHLESTVSDMEGRCGNGIFIWKIRNYIKLRAEAEKGSTPAVHSGSFYSSFYGYKLCIRVNLYGVDSAKGNYLSLFIHFMQGENDDLLEWPFNGRIVLTIIDQNPICELRQHISETLMSKPNLAAFQKPTSARNHKGFGYMEFVPLSTIDGSTYIRNDTLIIKANVIPNNT